MSDKRNEILVVDDNPENLRVLTTLLESEGYDVRAATDGPQALESVKISEPDLAILDVHLPEINGFEVCRRMLEDVGHTRLPILFLSALGDSFNKLQAARLQGRGRRLHDQTVRCRGGQGEGLHASHIARKAPGD